MGSGISVFRHREFRASGAAAVDIGATHLSLPPRRATAFQGVTWMRNLDAAHASRRFVR
jgi:hypothetical protein